MSISEEFFQQKNFIPGNLKNIQLENSANSAILSGMQK